MIDPRHLLANLSPFARLAFSDTLRQLRCWHAFRESDDGETLTCAKCGAEYVLSLDGRQY